MNNTPPADKKIVKVWITDDCLQNETCVMVAREVFDLPEEPPPDPEPHIAKVKPDAAQYFESHKAKIEEAARACPTKVIKVQYEDGSVFDGMKLMAADEAPKPPE